MSKVAPREHVFFLLRNKLREFSESANILKNSYPFLVSLNSRKHSIFVNETHDSGSGRPNEDECRKQINRAQWEAAVEHKSIFLGFDADINVFSIWNPKLIWNRSNPTTFSIYLRFS